MIRKEDVPHILAFLDRHFRVKFSNDFCDDLISLKEIGPALLGIHKGDRDCPRGPNHNVMLGHDGKTYHSKKQLLRGICHDCNMTWTFEDET